MTGRQSPNPLDRLMNGQGQRSSPISASSYISVANKHTLFTTFMTIEEKLLLKVGVFQVFVVASTMRGI